MLQSLLQDRLDAEQKVMRAAADISSHAHTKVQSGLMQLTTMKVLI